MFFLAEPAGKAYSKKYHISHSTCRTWPSDVLAGGSILTHRLIRRVLIVLYNKKCLILQCRIQSLQKRTFLNNAYFVAKLAIWLCRNPFTEVINPKLLQSVI